MQVYIANNNEIARFGLCKIVESIDTNSHIACGHSKELLRDDIDWNRFDFIILNRLRRKDDVSAFIGKLKLLETKIKVLILSDQTGFSEMQFLFSLGIKGYLDSSASLEVVRKAAEVILSGLLYVEPTMLVNYFDSSPQRSTKLSNKELEIAIFLVAGLRTSEISVILNKKASTISAHKRNIFSKLRINNVVELMRYMDVNPEIDLLPY